MGKTLPDRGETMKRRTLLVAAGILVLHFACAYALDAAGLVESLLSPSGGQLLWVLPLAVIFYALRLATYFVVPGLVVGCAILWLVEKARDRAV
jgi:hypothetical protein